MIDKTLAAKVLLTAANDCDAAGNEFNWAHDDIIDTETQKKDIETLVKQIESCGTLSAAYNAVRQFHKTFGHPAPDVPQMQPDNLVTRRAAWIMSEVDELVEAPTIIQQADAYLDVIYFALGGLVELGVEPSAIFDLVQAANMAKIWPDGSVQKDATGKVIKPVGWVAPDAAIADAIAQQIVDAIEQQIADAINSK